MSLFSCILFSKRGAHIPIGHGTWKRLAAKPWTDHRPCSPFLSSLSRFFGVDSFRSVPRAPLSSLLSCALRPLRAPSPTPDEYRVKTV